MKPKVPHTRTRVGSPLQAVPCAKMCEVHWEVSHEKSMVIWNHHEGHTLWPSLPSFLSVLVYPSRSVSHHLLVAAEFGHPGAVSVHKYRQVREISNWQFDVQEIIGNLWSLTLLEWQRDRLCRKCAKLNEGSMPCVSRLPLPNVGPRSFG